jgi:hypothetical protein
MESTGIDLRGLISQSLQLWNTIQVGFIGPMVVAAWDRFKKQLPNEDYKDEKTELKSSKIDYLMKFYMFLYLINHCLESYITGFLGTLPTIMAVVMAYRIFVVSKLPYYPWFTILPLALNSLLFIFPNIYLRLFFFLSCGLCYYGLGQAPFKGRKHYKSVRIFIIIATILVLKETYTKYKALS